MELLPKAPPREKQGVGFVLVQLWALGDNMGFILKVRPVSYRTHRGIDHRGRLGCMLDARIVWQVSNCVGHVCGHVGHAGELAGHSSGWILSPEAGYYTGIAACVTIRSALLLFANRNMMKGVFGRIGLGQFRISGAELC